MDKKLVEKNLTIIREVQDLEGLNETPLFTWDDMRRHAKEAKREYLLNAIGVGIMVGFVFAFVFGWAISKR